MTYLLLVVIAISCAAATFIENDFGTLAARSLVYESLWFEALLALSMFNLTVLIIQTKMYKTFAKFLIHASLIVILFASFLTRYLGFEGMMFISEKSYANTVVSAKNYIEIWLEKENLRVHKRFAFEAHPFSKTLHKTLVFDGKNYEIEAFVKDIVKKARNLEAKVVVNIKSEDFQDIFEMVVTPNKITTPISKISHDLHVSVRHGSIAVQTPFRITLDDFILKKYPGSNYPSEYLSKVTFFDERFGERFSTLITMNQPLSYKGYKFFQTSYAPDEKGTILSINKDPGKIPTYIGYGLLCLGLLLSLFTKNSHLAELFGRVSKATFTLFVCSFLYEPLQANTPYMQNYLDEYKIQSKSVAREFGNLHVQSLGRMQPVDTLSQNILYKFSKKNSWHGMDANQIILGMLVRPDIWKKMPLFAIKSPALKKILHKEKTTSYVAINDLFDANKKYLLTDTLKEASTIKPSQQGTLHKEALRMNEHLEIANMVFGATLFALFPDTKNHTNQWRDFQSLWQDMDESQSKIVQADASSFLQAMYARDFIKASLHVKAIDTFQQKYGGDLLLSAQKVQYEIFWNKLQLFLKLTFTYLFVGLIALMLAFGSVFSEKLRKLKLVTILGSLIFLLFCVHLVGLASRWYLSGHAPMSDTYESMLYISFSALLCGLFFKKSLFALSASVLMASMFLLGAHLSLVDPQITTLVPVLKSFWLTLHVSVIAGSYGFLGVGALIGGFVLILFATRYKQKVIIDKQISFLSDINEIAIYIGLVLLLIGNTLGAIWANESWGRYWGWDPKETWTFISIVVYTALSHLKHLHLVDFHYWFNAFSLVSFASVLMTYFGVNYYLAGMHSYATGDLVPIPAWVYVSVLFVGFLIIVSIAKRKNLKG